MRCHGIKQTVAKIRKTGTYGPSSESKILRSEFNRSHYVYCCFHAAKLASKLGNRKMSVIEFGCAGSTGLIALEKFYSNVSKPTGVEIEIYCFDSGKGLPEPQDYKDLPYHWRGGFFKMDQQSLAPKLLNSKIVLGDVKDTVKEFIKDYNSAIIGCVCHDLDYYSSTQASFQLFEENERHFLPRSFHYFDDIIASEIELYTGWTGELLAPPFTMSAVSLDIAWRVYIRVILGSLGTFDLSLAFAFFAILIWCLADLGLLGVDSVPVMTHIILFLLPATLDTGIYWFHIRAVYQVKQMWRTSKKNTLYAQRTILLE